MNYAKIKSVKKINRGRTYDLEVDHDDHTFYANEISVSNSHAIAYSITSYHCAYLLTYFPEKWCCAYLDKESEDRKELAIASVKSAGFTIGEILLKDSDGYYWKVKDGILVPPLSSIKGLGESAISELLKFRPFNSIEELIDHPEMDYRKFNKKGMDVLSRSGTLNYLIDNRFSGTKHFWASIQLYDKKAANKKKAPKFFKDFIEEAEENFSGNFSKEEYINNSVELTGVYPIETVCPMKIIKLLENKMIPPVSEYDEVLGVAWLVPREIIAKKTGKGKDYYIIKCTDINSAFVEVKCWGVDTTRDIVYTDRVYAVKLSYNETWGFSTNGGLVKWKMMT